MKIKIVFLVLIIGSIILLTGYDKSGFTDNKTFADVYEWYSNPTHPLSPYNPLNPGSPLYDRRRNENIYPGKQIFAMGIEIHTGKPGTIYNHNEFSVKIELYRWLLWNHLISTKILMPKSSEQYGEILNTDKLFAYKRGNSGEFEKWQEVKLQ